LEGPEVEIKEKSGRGSGEQRRVRVSLPRWKLEMRRMSDEVGRVFAGEINWNDTFLS